MTITGYACDMSNTPPSKANIVNPEALEGFMRAFDHALMGRYGIGSEHIALEGKKSIVHELEHKVVKTLLTPSRKTHRLSVWYYFQPVNAIRRFRDDIRLRRYNRELIKKNIH